MPVSIKRLGCSNILVSASMWPATSEMRGIPIRLELGPRDLENGQCVLVSRVTGEKKSVSLDNLVAEVQTLLAQIHDDMFERALEFQKENFFSVDTLDEYKAAMEEKRGFALAG